jgi:uncharacterized protein (TIGR02118 family)
MRKVVVVTHGESRGVRIREVTDSFGLTSHTPSPDVPPAQPEDVHEISFVWLPDDVDPGAWVMETAQGMQVTAYLVDQRVQWDYERDWPDGAPSPGVKQLSFVRRLPSITRDEFAAHWNDVHAPLARVHHPGIWRYVQNVVVEPLTPAAPELDGVAELHFRTVDDLRDRMYDSEEGKARIRADVKTFIDVPAGWRMMATERILTTPPH